MLNIFVPDLGKTEIEVLKEIRGVRKKEVKIWLSQSVYSSIKIPIMDMKPIESGVNLDWTLLCKEWNCKNQNVNNVQDSYRYWLTRYDMYSGSDEWVILNSTQRPKGHVVLFFDHPTDSLFPKYWGKFKCLTSKAEYDSYIQGRDFLIFSFHSGSKFDHTKYVVKGAAVLKERNSGYLWYLDTFHRNHFEVWDSTGKTHIGEADIKDGKLDISKADRSKHPIL